MLPFVIFSKICDDLEAMFGLSNRGTWHPLGSFLLTKRAISLEDCFSLIYDLSGGSFFPSIIVIAHVAFVEVFVLFLWSLETVTFVVIVAY